MRFCAGPMNERLGVPEVEVPVAPAGLTRYAP